jgi:beta-lactamase class A
VAALAMSVQPASRAPPVDGAAAAAQKQRRAYPWRERVAEARRFARRRAGIASFAIVGERGNLRGYKPRREFASASVVKVMLMVCYLRQPGVRNRRLHAGDRRLLAPMIRRSGNAAATAIRDMVGNDSLLRLARAAHMRDFQTHVVWGLTQISARDQALLMYRLRRYIPRRHRRYALHLLADVVSYQRWGIPPARPRGWRVYFKGGWTAAAGGWRIHQVARLRRGRRKLAVAVLTQGNPSHDYGTKTVRGVTARLLRRYNRLTG